jgi:GT2 family glycosyltransferase
MDADLTLPPTSTHAGTLPRIVAVLVVHDGAEWLGNVLATIAGQRYPALDLVVVDNASADGSPEMLSRRIPPERLITLPRPVGFGRAVQAALQNEAFDGADLVWLVHDDLALAPDALNRLATALRADEQLGVVGPKLRDWDEEPVLQEVGMTIDRFGRAESFVEPGERDQGQHDVERDVLFVSTAGMLLRLDMLRELGGFDPRLAAFRDDLDLCWRAWLAGWRVAVVPDAIGYHVAAASRLARPVGRGRPGEARYLAERHTLATLLKNYGGLRLAWVLPLVWLLGVVKVAAFAVTRRFADALAVVRAWLWNLAQLPATLRRRRFVQSRRAISDGELSRVFAPGLPRLRTYTEALGSWLAGGGTRALLEDQPAEEEIAEGHALWRALRDHPVAAAGGLLLVLYLVALSPLLGGGQLVGGEVAPWPAEAADFLRAYAAPWNGEPLGTDAFPSPVQALLGLASFAGFGSAWLAQRLVVFGLVPLAWVLAVRAGRLLTARPLPRALGATVYALSPPVLGALSQGRFGALVAAALLPGVVLLAARAADPQARPKTAWRAAALLAFGMAVLAAAEPSFGVLLAAGWVVALMLAARGGRQPVIRLAVAAGAAGLLLVAWVLGLLREGAWPLLPAAEPLPLWRALSFAPPTLEGLVGAGAWVWAALVGASVVAGVLLGLKRRPGAVAGLVAGLAAAAVAAWALARWPVPGLEPGVLLVVGVLALAGLVTVAARWAVEGLGTHAFGARQVTVALAAVVFAAGLGAGLVRLAGAPWTELARGPEVVPAFVAADTARVGAYRILRLDEVDGEVRWDVLRADGPSMLAYGTTPSRTLRAFVDEAVAGAVGGADQGAGARLGVANVRYVVADAPSLRALLGGQPALDPLPAGGGRVFRVQTWLPRAVVLPDGVAGVLADGRDPGPLREFEEDGLVRHGPALLVGRIDEPGVLVLSEGVDSSWQAVASGVRLQREDLLAVNAFSAPDPGRVSVRLGGAGHRTIIAAQLLLGLALLSLALRPPGTTQERLQRATVGRLPTELEAADEPAPVGPEPGP